MLHYLTIRFPVFMFILQLNIYNIDAVSNWSISVTALNIRHLPKCEKKIRNVVIKNPFLWNISWTIISVPIILEMDTNVTKISKFFFNKSKKRENLKSIKPTTWNGLIKFNPAANQGPILEPIQLKTSRLPGKWEIQVLG